MRYGKLDRKTFKPLEQLVEIRGLAAGKAAHVKAAIRPDLDQPSLCQYPDRLAEGGSTHPQPVDHPLLVQPSATREFAGQNKANDFLIDPLAQSSLTQLFKILDQHKDAPAGLPIWGLRIATSRPSARRYRWSI